MQIETKIGRHRETERDRTEERKRNSYIDNTDGSWMVLASMLPDSREKQRVTE